MLTFRQVRGPHVRFSVGRKGCPLTRSWSRQWPSNAWNPKAGSRCGRTRVGLVRNPGARGASRRSKFGRNMTTLENMLVIV